MPQKKILFICGSLNQTTQMTQIASQIGEHDCFFTPFYADGLVDLAARAGLADFTVLGGRHLEETLDFLGRRNLPLDPRGEKYDYDLVVTCSDLIVQDNVRRKRLVLVQEGITEPESFVYDLVKWLKLPRYLANTATNGLSDAYDVFCVASHGYRDLFIGKGARPEKIIVTGIPNFDHLQAACDNDFPYRGHVLAATSPLRESFRADDRPAFLKKCLRIADGRQLIFKLHPIENEERAVREIREHCPGAMVFARGNVNHMIANAAVVVTQQSTCTFVAVGLGKETHTNLDMDQLRRLMPIQNGGTSAVRIANICRRVLRTPMRALQHVRQGIRRRPHWEQADSY